MMIRMKEIYVQVKDLTPLLLKFYLPSMLLLAGLLFLKLVYNIKISNLTRDPIQVLGGDPSIGILSNLGNLLWVATASITFYTSFLLRKATNQQSAARFLLFSALLTSFLLVDDLFLMHDMVLPMIFNLHEFIVYGFYGVTVALYLLVFYREILASEFVLLGLAGAFLAGSMLLDFVYYYVEIPYVFLLEDGAKFLGIVTWFLYFTRMDLHYLKQWYPLD